MVSSISYIVKRTKNRRRPAPPQVDGIFTDEMKWVEQLETIENNMVNSLSGTDRDVMIFGMDVINKCMPFNLEGRELKMHAYSTFVKLIEDKSSLSSEIFGNKISSGNTGMFDSKAQRYDRNFRILKHPLAATAATKLRRKNGMFNTINFSSERLPCYNKKWYLYEEGLILGNEDYTKEEIYDLMPDSDPVVKSDMISLYATIKKYATEMKTSNGWMPFNIVKHMANHDTLENLLEYMSMYNYDLRLIFALELGMIELLSETPTIPVCT
jgi:hypothetical protein